MIHFDAIQIQTVLQPRIAPGSENNNANGHREPTTIMNVCTKTNEKGEFAPNPFQ